jgi:molybdenum cofactor guanylyltransferase
MRSVKPLPAINLCGSHQPVSAISCYGPTSVLFLSFVPVIFNRNMEKPPPVTGIVLAGGKSTRMGTEKGLVRFKGQNLIDYAIAALKPHCNQLLISSHSEQYQYPGCRVVKDVFPDSGPMGGIYSCLLQSDNEINFVMSCDMPLVPDHVVSRILRLVAEYDIAVPWHGRQYFEPLCAAYKRSLLPKFEKFIREKNFKIPDLIQKVRSIKIAIGEENGLNPMYFFNVNSKSDLKMISSEEPVGSIKPLPNLMLIAGTGRKVGKTTFACSVISHLAKSQKVTGIKISPHFHQQAEGQKILHQGEAFQIIEETNSGTGKDSARMLRAGASGVYYLQTIDKNIKKPFDLLLSLIPENQPVICESGALLHYAKPGLFVLVRRTGQTAFKAGIDTLTYLPDYRITFDGDNFDPDPGRFVFEGGRWKCLKDSNH